MDNSKNVTNWISTGSSPEKIKPFDTSLATIMSNLANGKVNLKFNNSVLAQTNSSSLYSNFILNLYIVYELNDWLHDPSNNFSLKNCLFGTVIKKRNQK